MSRASRRTRCRRLWIGVLLTLAPAGLGASGCTRAPDPYGPESVFIVDSDGGNRRELVDDATLEGWSPDGRLIAVVAGGTDSEVITSEGAGTGLTALEVIHPDGTGRSALRRYPQPTDVGAAWSPDSRRLAVFDAPRRDKLRRSTVSVLEVEPKGVPRVVFSRNQDTVDSVALAWSPNGRVVAFSGHDGPPAGGDSFFVPDVIVAPVDGASRRVPSLSDDGNIDPVWLPDGRSLVVSSWDENGDSYSLLEEISLDGHRRPLLRRVTGPAAVSPDGRLIAVPTFRGSAPLLRRVVTVIPRPRGATDETEIALEADVVAWSPDGRTLAVGGTEGLHLISKDGWRIRRIVELDPPHTFTGVAWSPDGKRLSFSQYHSGFVPTEE
jgi:WD40 repeat protein